jgi:hypothetical protein
MSRHDRFLSLGDGIPVGDDGTPRGNPALEDLGAVIRELYVIHRRLLDPDGSSNYGVTAIPKWDGGVDRFGTHQPIWPRVAALVVQNKFNPTLFIKAQFSDINPTRPPPPTFFLSQAAVEKYRAYTATLVPDLQAAFDRQLVSLDTRLQLLRLLRGRTERELITLAITDRVDLDATPLFRFCMACQAELPGVAAAYRGSALFEYAMQAEYYDRAWGVERFPPDFRQEAAALYASLTH